MMTEINQDQYEYGFRLGLEAGRFSAKRLSVGKETDHGDLLSANDPYADGYRQGLNERGKS
jgi:hypothetical protein